MSSESVDTERTPCLRAPNDRDASEVCYLELLSEEAERLARATLEVDDDGLRRTCLELAVELIQEACAIRKCRIEAMIGEKSEVTISQMAARYAHAGAVLVLGIVMQ